MDLTIPSPLLTNNTIPSYWPIFGDKNPVMVKKFWEKTKELIHPDTIIFKGDFLRLGKKKQKPKSYHFMQKFNKKQYIDSLKNDNSLWYFKKAGDKKAKGVIQLDPNIILRLSYIQIKADKSCLGIKLSKNDKVNYTLFVEKDTNLVFKLWEKLVTVCTMDNFDDMYYPLSQLGKGSFATVYKVKRLVDDQLFAAKIYYRDVLNTSHHKERFVQMILNEISSLRQLEQVGIARIYEVYQQQDRVVLITELVSGPDLYQLIRRKKTLNETRACFIITQLAYTLQAIHEYTYNIIILPQRSGFVHRDVKLENILLSSQETYETKLVDFGFAEPINETVLLGKAGTPGYIPPEIYFNKPFTTKGDIFGLGVVLFSIVGGYSPFKGNTYHQIMEANRKADMQFDKPIWSTISNECKDLILNMCLVDVKKRFSALQVLEHPWIKKFSPGESNPEQQSQFQAQSVQQQMPDGFQDFQNPNQNIVPSFYKQSVKIINQQSNEPLLDQFDDIEDEVQILTSQQISQPCSMLLAFRKNRSFSSKKELIFLIKNKDNSRYDI